MRAGLRGIAVSHFPEDGDADGPEAEGVPRAVAGGIHAVCDVPRHDPPGRRGVSRRARRGHERAKDGPGLLAGLLRESRDCRRTVRRSGTSRPGALQADPLCDGWRERPAQGAAGTIRQEAGAPTLCDPQEPEPAAAPGHAVPQRGPSRLKAALEQTHYADARHMLLELEAWLRTKNESAADSLLEAFEELLTVHRLKVPALLRKTLMSTNPIESMFSLVRHSERNIKRSRGSAMLQRWLGTVLLYCEQQFKRVKGFAGIAEVIATIEAEHAEQQPVQTKKAA